MYCKGCVQGIDYAASTTDDPRDLVGRRGRTPHVSSTDIFVAAVTRPAFITFETLTGTAYSHCRFQWLLQNGRPTLAEDRMMRCPMSWTNCA